MMTGYRLVGMGNAVWREGQPQRAATLFGAASRIFDELGNWGGVRLDLDELRAMLGEATFTLAWDEGRALTFEQALDYAVEEDGLRADPPGEQDDSEVT
jgi:hypothetical protein